MQITIQVDTLVDTSDTVSRLGAFISGQPFLIHGEPIARPLKPYGYASSIGLPADFTAEQVEKSAQMTAENLAQDFAFAPAEPKWTVAPPLTERVAPQEPTTASQEPQPEPAKRTRRTKAQMQASHTHEPDSQSLDVSVALDTALDNIPGVVDLTAGTDEPAVVETVVTDGSDTATDEPPTTNSEPPVTSEAFDLLGGVLEDEPKAVQTPASTPSWTLQTAGAEIRRLTVANRGDWLRARLDACSVQKISELSLEQAIAVLQHGQIFEAEAKGV